MPSDTSSLMTDIITSVLFPILSLLGLMVFVCLIVGMFGGAPAAFKVAGFFFNIFFRMSKIVFSVLALVFRRFFSTSRVYVQDTNNKSVVWNVTAGLVGFICVWYLFGSVESIYNVYKWQDDGWLVLGFIGLASIRGSLLISNAPMMKATKFTKEWGNVLADGICGLAFASALVHLELYFVHKHFPQFSLIVGMVIYVAFIAYIVVKLTDNSGSITAQFDAAAASGGNYKGRENADILLAHTKPTMAKPKSEEMIIPEKSRNQHLQGIGPTGVGKTILLLNLILQDLLDLKVGVLALEPTKDMVKSIRAVCKKIGRKYHYIDPTDPNTAVINPLHGDDVDEICEINAGAFMGYVGEKAPEFYKNKQKNALRMAIKVAKYLKKDEATYIDLLDILRPTNGALRDEYHKRIKDESIRAELEEYTVEFSDPKMFNNALQNYAGLIDYLKEITSNKYLRSVLCRPSTVNIREVFDNGEVLLITTAYGKLKQLGFVLGRLMITMIQSETFARSELDEEVRDQLPQMACYVDEVQNYVSEPFAEIFEMARKVRIMMHIFHQGLSQLRRISERLEKSIFDNARQKIIFGGVDIEDCEYFAKKIGQYYKHITSTSSAVFNAMQVNQMEREELRLKMLPSEIHKLPGFNTKTFEPAEALCLLVINNVIMDEQIGLIAPLPRSIWKDTDIIMNVATGNGGEDKEEYGKLNTTPSDENKIINYTTNGEHRQENEGEYIGGHEEVAAALEDGRAGETEQTEGKKTNRRKKRSKNSADGDPEAAVRDEDTLSLNDMHSKQDEDTNSSKMTDDELLLLMHDEDK